MARVARAVIYVLLTAACALGVFRTSVPYNEIAAAVLATLLLVAIDAALRNLENLRYAAESLRFFKDEVRISVSYLYRIKIKGLYFLIRGHRIPNQYQPVGGVIKRFPDGTQDISSLGTLNDGLFPVDDTSLDDLRIRISGKNMLRFMRWYKSGKGRETDPWREFYEEVVGPGIVPREQFGYVFTRHVRRHVTAVRFSKPSGCYERLIAEIYELIPNDEQFDVLSRLQHERSREYIWATEDAIRREGVGPTKPHVPIAPTAEWTL